MQQGASSEHVAEATLPRLVVLSALVEELLNLLVSTYCSFLHLGGLIGAFLVIWCNSVLGRATEPCLSELAKRLGSVR